MSKVTIGKFEFSPDEFSQSLDGLFGVALSLSGESLKKFLDFAVEMSTDATFFPVTHNSKLEQMRFGSILYDPKGHIQFWLVPEQLDSQHQSGEGLTDQVVVKSSPRWLNTQQNALSASNGLKTLASILLKKSVLTEAEYQRVISQPSATDIFDLSTQVSNLAEYLSEYRLSIADANADLEDQQ